MGHMVLVSFKAGGQASDEQCRTGHTLQQVPPVLPGSRKDALAMAQDHGPAPPHHLHEPWRHLLTA